MSRLFIRNRSCGYITFLHTKQELVDFMANYLPGRALVIGDIATFNKPMRQALLKFIEENPSVSCYSSEDLVDPILQSRFHTISKEPLVLDLHHNVDDYLASDKSYQSAHMCLNALSATDKLRAPRCKRIALKLLLKNI